MGQALRPLARTDAAALSGPFADRGRPLSEDVLDALFLASGGIPAILTFGLQQLWQLDREATTRDVAAAAIVQLAEAELSDWHERYRRECLEPLDVDIEVMPVEGTPIRARYRCTSSTVDGLDVEVDHFLLRLARRL